ncbi:serine hydrolase domain-containing protein [Saccharothrix longispora]|uniref:CubicO group peptidase (Beta-lactamase class C family) n=1 Tax=Saccharothrix longispora TaxID=33920 RepID=A0ABU1PMZ5_9PSEU|nr:serine hydrolase domain-containing protein [Saccharothrix longispora]MDR6591941.1 CubicO group peptidase (beta-lactamase class C family) [Saccharothrix longispora]
MKYLITALVLVLAAPVPAAHADPATDFEDYLERAARSTGLPGLAAVVTHRDRVVLATGFGHDSDGNPVTADTPMRIASVSKSFTAMAVMTLVEDGRIALDEPVAARLPGFTMADPRHERITARHLLNQTSGLSDTTVDTEALRDATSLADYASRLRADSLADDPGTRYRYCNVNYDLAARLVEVASGRRFRDYLREAVFAPLGMSRSAVSDDELRPADGYNSLFGAWVPRPEMPGFHDDSGAGGVITTAADLGRWLVSQNGYGTRLVSAEGLRTMHTPSTVDEYAMGWAPDDAGRLTHSGNLFTYNAVQAIVPGTGHGFAVLTNGAGVQDDTYPVLEGLAAIAEGGRPEDPGGGRQAFELVLGLVVAASAVLAVVGVRRARRWAERRAGAARWRAVARLLPVLLPVAVFAAYPYSIEVVSSGRTVTWEQLTYFAAPLTIALGVAALSGLVVAFARVVRLRSVQSAR